jgi:L-histidine N-alpha-methyltransferase
VRGVSVVQPRVSTRPAALETSTAQFAEDVRYYLSLTPRQLPSHYLYDALGSALFEAICNLPWYGLTRGELSLVTAHAEDIVSAMRPLTRVVELGPGSGEKLGALIGTAPRGNTPLHVHLIDVSAQALDGAARSLSTFDHVRVIAHRAPYEIGLDQVRHDPPVAGRALAMFLGSNIGNFDPAGADALLTQIRAALDSGDALLLGVDLVKPERELLLAYDDPLQVTAAFNRNLLVRINRELGANFEIEAFRHRAIWNGEQSRVEMHLVADGRQSVDIPAAGLRLVVEPGESIWTESSYKFQREGIVDMLTRNGFRMRSQWIDADSQFALTLADLP